MHEVVDPGGALPLASSVVVPLEVERAMLDILAPGLAPGETLLLAYQRKERELRALFARLSVFEARELHRRLSLCRADDALAAVFGRLLESRRGRLLEFLADARRREALAMASSLERRPAPGCRLRPRPHD